MKKIERLEVETPLIRKSPASIIGMAVGFIFAGLGTLMVFTIILLVPGVCLTLIGLGVAAASVPKIHAECPACGTENNVMMKADNMKCIGCTTVTPLIWRRK